VAEQELLATLAWVSTSACNRIKYEPEPDGPPATLMALQAADWRLVVGRVHERGKRESEARAQ
jgi:hypothetical protein